MSDLQAAKRFLKSMSEHAAEPVPVLAAVSGGMDSMCLLHLLATWGRRRNLRVTAAHFNHRLRGEAADRDEDFVRFMCKQWNVPFVCGSGDTRALASQEGLSIEEAARKLRYAFLEQIRQDGQYTFILTAHHADDNAETVLLNLLRGTGAKGLTGIPEYRGSIARPFLKVLREELEAYAKEHDIPYVEDETNRKLDATRNVLRHKVMPVLRELNPRVVENMNRTAELLARDERALHRQAEQLLEQYARFDEKNEATLSKQVCLRQPTAVVSRVVLMLLKRISGRRQDLSSAHVEAVLELLREGRPGQTLSLPYDMTVQRQEHGISVQIKESKKRDARAIVPGETLCFGDWQVCLITGEQTEGADCYPVELPDHAVVQVTNWQSRDRMTLPGSRGSRSVKRLAAERGISPVERDQLPVLRINGCPAIVPGIGVDEKFTPNDETKAYLAIFLKQTEENGHEK